MAFSEVLYLFPHFSLSSALSSTCLLTHSANWSLRRAMEQFEQLLTCCVCLDRYRIPKLLPCQHSFCMEPCMEGLVDYVRRQVKCPECRAEHRIPYQGVQAFPTNVTLQRFLELHIEITGELPDPTSGEQFICRLRAMKCLILYWSDCGFPLSLSHSLRFLE